MRERGLSLVQAVVATALVAILAMVSLPLFLSAIQNYRFRAAVDQIVGQIRQARAVAVTKGNVAGFHMMANPCTITTPRAYRIERSATGTTWPNDCDTPSTNATYVITLWQDLAQLFPGVTVSQPVDAGGTTLARITINSLGNSVATGQHPISITITNSPSGSSVVQVTSLGSVRRP